MTHRLPVLIALCALLASIANAGIIIAGNPHTLHGQVGAMNVVVKGWVTGVKLTGRHGRTVTVVFPRALPLDGALPIPSGDWADLTLELAGPVTVSVEGRGVNLDVPSLTVALDEPDASQVHLEWSLPEGLLSAISAGMSPTALASALEDGGLAR